MTPKPRKTGKVNINAAAAAVRDEFLAIFGAGMPDQVIEPLRFDRLEPEEKEDWRRRARVILRAAEILPALAVGTGKEGI